MMAAMKLLSMAVLLAATFLPLAASAQQVQQPLPQGAPVNGQQHGPSRGYDRWMHRLSGLNLSSQQQAQVQSVLGQYYQSHPAGAPREKGASKALRQQIFSTLTPQQQAQLRQEMPQKKHHRRDQEMEQQPQAESAPPQ